ncbi:MAG: FAD-dependent oxidoreductase, partial [Candidatus Krumholzibacteria bacterium]|nr:FAD-dependent oxidoreductase [Candidatus Krumholzibacteria bacterium]
MAGEKYQLVVIGAGPGGYAAAFLAADLGMNVALVDPEKNPGGVCLYRGCIPSKALLHVARLMNEVEEAKQMGVDYPEPKIDVEKLRGWKNSVVDRLTGGLGQLTKRRKVEYIQGTATIRGAHTIDVNRAGGGAETISFDHAIVATGSRPAVIPAFDLDTPRVLNSKTALDLESVPQSMLVVGGGYIGLELGSVYAALGTKVSVVEMLPGILPGADRDLVNVLAKGIGKKFESVMVNTTVSSMKETDNGIAVTYAGDDV